MTTLAFLILLYLYTYKSAFPTFSVYHLTFPYGRIYKLRYVVLPLRLQLCVSSYKAQIITEVL